MKKRLISILLCGKTNLSKIIGVEVQQEVADMAKRSTKLNDLENKFEVINENIINLDKIYENNSFDAIVTNPPYKKENTGILNDEKKKLISRHEILAKLEDYIKISNKLLKEICAKNEEESDDIETDDIAKLIGCVNALSKHLLHEENLIKNDDPQLMKKAVAFCQSIAVSKQIMNIFNGFKEYFINSSRTL